MKKSMYLLLLLVFGMCGLSVIESVKAEAEGVGHIVTFDPDNDTSYLDWFKTEVEDGGLVTERPQDPEKAGYKFIGWYYTLDSDDQPIYWDFEKDRVTDNTTLWAAYVKTHMVTFDPENGSMYPDWFKTEVEDGGLVTERPQDPEKAGYKFIGWYYTLDSDDQPIYWDFERDRVTDNTTLWAAYVKLYIVTFNPQNGTEESKWQTLSVPAGSTIDQEIPIPKREGYQFVGWSKQSEERLFWVFDRDTVNTDQLLYAIWYKNKDETKEEFEEQETDNGVLEEQGTVVSDGISKNEGEKGTKEERHLPQTGTTNSSFYLVLIGIFMLGSTYYLKDKNTFRK